MNPRSSAAHPTLGVANALVLACLLGACGEPGPTDPRPLVLVSVAPQGYVVERLAGDLVQVEVMVPTGANPTTHVPTLAQLRLLSEAEVYLEIGHPDFAFERAWLEDIAAEAPGLTIVPVAGSVPRAGGDPHVWVAPGQMAVLVEKSAEALAELLPQHRAAIESNAGALRDEIHALDSEIAAQLAGCRDQPFVVLHPAWGHFAKAYHLQQVAIEHEHKQPDVRELRVLIARARRDEVRVVFAQPQFDPAAAETLASEIGARVEFIDPLAEDWAANLRRVAAILQAEVCR